MSKCNVSYFFRVFLGCFLGLCCAIFSVPVKANYNNLTWSEIATGFRDTRGVPGATGNFERIANTSSSYSSLPNNSNYRGGITLSGTFTSPAKRIPYAGAAILRPNPVSMAGATARLLTSNPYVFAGSLAFATFNSANGFTFNESKNVLELEIPPDGDWLNLPAAISNYSSGLFVSNFEYDLTGSVGSVDNRRSNQVAEMLSQRYPYEITISNPDIPTFRVRSCPTNAPVGDYPFIGFVWDDFGNPRCAYKDGGVSPPLYSLDSRPVLLADLPSPENYSDYDGFFSEPSLMPVILSETSPFDSNGNPDFNLNFEVPSQSIDLGTSVSTSVSDGVSTVKETTSKLELESVTSGAHGESGSVVEKETTETKTYVDGQLVNTETTEESTEDAVLPVPPSVELELPEGCALFDPFCKWAEWTQQDLDEEEPDFSLFINEFEPDEDSYSLDLGGAVCPAPITINIGFLNKDLELSYEPACDLMTMIRPLILASAYLLAAYIYLGVLRG